DAMPYPRYGKFELDKYVSRAIPIVSSRGCPYSCIFCSVKASMGRKVRARSSANVLEEIEYWYEKGRRRFGFVDDNFTFYADRVLDICDLIEKRRLRDLELLCINGLRADKVTRELLKRMRQVGFYSIAFGVEGGNDKTLKNVKKGEKLETIRRAIEAACDLDYEVTLHFVIGTPGETEEDIEDSFSLARRYPVSNVYFNNLMPYPGTELYDWVQSKGYFAADPAECFDSVSSWADIPVFETPELTFNQRRQALLRGKQIMRQVRKEHFRKKLRQYGLPGRFTARLLFWMDTAKGLLRDTKVGRAVARQLKPFLSK
ncbi:radical SAM protein, partial [Candidatus Bathyarchaeota archaeon]|nr:radical SAM protein [Candidatus Bathyarchaeota archaeon]